MLNQPLANKVRPQKLEEIVGQKHLLAPGKQLRLLVEQKKPTSYIFHGPAGTGKTTLANVIATQLELPTEFFNATIDNKAKLQKLIKAHDDTFALILDEIHRLTAPLQDFLLPYLENGHIILLGCTTENPILSIAPAIRSRCLMFALKPVSADDIKQRLVQIWQKYYQKDNNPIPENLDKIAQLANGDVRTALNYLEVAMTIDTQAISDDTIQQLSGSQTLIFDKQGDNHYNTISALQKSIRGSDTDAALYYTGIMCLANDLKTLIRRLKVIAYEDIGLADPDVVNQAVTALLAAENLGLPEARIPIAQAVILLATAPKSNTAYKALDQAMADGEIHGVANIPNHLKDAHYSGHEKLGVTGYLYPHDYPHHWVKQRYLPLDIPANRVYVDIDGQSPKEQKIIEVYKRLKRNQLRRNEKE